MRAIKNTYDLIHSMTSSQKRYFKRYMQLYSNGQKEIVLIFDVLNKHKMLEESVISTELKQQKVKHPSVKLRYLFETILDCLVAYEVHSKNVEAKIDRLTRHARILLKKGFYQKSLDYIQKAKTDAYKHEKFDMLISILEQEHEILAFGYNYRNNTDTINDLLIEKAGLIEKMLNFNEYTQLNNKVVNIRYQQKDYKTAIRKTLKTNELLQKEENCLSVTGKYKYYNILVNAHYELEEWEKALELLEQQIELQYNHIEIFNQERFAASINNLLILCIQLKDKSRFFKHLTIINKILTDSKQDSDAAFLFYIKSHNLLKYYVLCEKSEDALSMLEDIEKGLETYGNYFQTRSKLVLAFYQLNMCICYKEHDKMLDYLVVMEEHLKNTDSSEEYIMAKLMSIVGHIELRNKSIVESQIRALKYFLSKEENKEVNTVFMKLLIKHLGKINKRVIFNKPQLLEECLDEMKEELSKHQDKQAVAVLGTFDFYKWVESLCEDQTVAEIRWQNNLIIREEAAE